MKKCILLLLVGVALLSCKNEEREQCIRDYYEAKLHLDTLFVQQDALQTKIFKLAELQYSSAEASIEYDKCQLEMSILNGQIDTYLDVCSSLNDLADISKKPFDRNYWKIYEKELKKQGRIK